MDLKPCPFCGGRAKVVTDIYRERFINDLFGRITDPAAKNAWVLCTVCGSRGRTITDKQYDGYVNRDRERILKEDAAAAWNRRKEKDHDTLEEAHES